MKQYIAKLKNGETVRFRPHGNSMTPRIESGALVTVEPTPAAVGVQVGDVVLCTVKGSCLLHLVGAMGSGRFRIENNHGHVNGWASAEHVHGKVTRIEA